MILCTLSHLRKTYFLCIYEVVKIFKNTNLNKCNLRIPKRNDMQHCYVYVYKL